MNKPAVTIIMGTFNRAHLIEETLVSIQNQTFKNWECLIIDDGSTDNTKLIIDYYLKIDTRFNYFQRPSKHKKGLPGCRNFGLDIAKGNYIIFFDDDDIVHPQNLEFCLKVLQDSNFEFCVYNKQSFIGNFTENVDVLVMNQEERDLNLYDFITNKKPVASCTVMWHISCFNNIRFNEYLMYAEEWECYARILTSNKKGGFLGNILYFNRKHSRSNTGEFWANNPIRLASKVEACKLVLNNLHTKKMLTYRLGVYFVALAHFMKNKKIFEYLMTHKDAFNFNEYLKLIVRYYANDIIRPIYNIKKYKIK